MPRTRAAAAVTAATAALLLAAPGAWGSPAPAHPAVDPTGSEQASLVANEDARIVDVRSLGALARAQQSNLINSPYRLRTGSSYTLVLTPRSQAYTVDDLLQLAPQTFVRQADGAYLLSESLYVDQGATLRLQATSSPLRIRLQSDSAGFVSIVSFGGSLLIEGTKDAPVEVTSWDPATGRPDLTVSDGRAYIRTIGGSAALAWVRASDLGFWSGRTGGIAITGNDRPHVGLLGSSPTGTQTYGANHHLGHYALKRKGVTAPAPAAGAPAPPPPQAAGNGAIQPAGPLNPQEQPTSTTNPFQYAAGTVTNSTFTGDAFGLFLSGAKNFTVTASTFSHNLFSGVVVHRYVTGAVLQRDVASNNGGDGFDVTRAASNVQLLDDVANANAGIGVSINGNPLASAQSASGMALTPYGGHVVSDLAASGNGVAGIEVNGAVNSRVQDSTVTRSPMGIVVRGAAQTVTVVANTVSDASQHGISVRDGAARVTVGDNTVDGAGTGVYVRASTASVAHNTIDGGATHAISLIGAVGDSSVTFNRITGLGRGPIDVHRVTSGHVTVTSNDTSGWVDTRTWVRYLNQLLTPLSLLWIAVLLLVALTALRGRRRRHEHHPYPNTVPMAALTGRATEVLPAPTRQPAVVDLRDGAGTSLWIPGRRPPVGAPSGGS